jgi:WD40 repeat protein
MLYSGSWDACIKVWDLNTKQCVSTLFNTMGNAIYCLQAWDDEVVAGGRHKTLDIWNVENHVTSLQLYGHTNVLNCV